jgi:hypothetical protein
MGLHERMNRYDLTRGVEPNTLFVCEHCLWAIESREGNLPTLKHYIDCDDTESQCDWCGETEMDALYEILE